MPSDTKTREVDNGPLSRPGISSPKEWVGVVMGVVKWANLKGIRCSTVETRVWLAKRTIKACLLVGRSKWSERRAIEATFVVCCVSRTTGISRVSKRGTQKPSSAVDTDDVVGDELKKNGTGAANQSIRGGQGVVDGNLFSGCSGFCTTADSNLPYPGLYGHPKRCGPPSNPTQTSDMC